MQKLIVIFIVIAALALLVRRLWHTVKGEDGCNCGSPNCPYQGQCDRRKHNE